MTEYRISGVWYEDDVIEYYAIHEGTLAELSRATKTSKAEAIKIVANPKNNVRTIKWNYVTAKWVKGEEVNVTTGANRYLHTVPNSTVTDNLSHLIDYDWLS
ncbi:MAG: DUF3892 domain-containing protein [Flavobacterium sp.]|nr:DUF3892 domain-containing protein [Flavobacterium sp.]